VADFLIPDWPVPAHVRALQTLRTGGCSPAPWASFNLGDHVGDDPARVATNRAELRRQLPAEPLWLRQVHGTAVVDAGHVLQAATADASFSVEQGKVCAVMTADCLPVLLCDRCGTVVAAAHAGWRSLAAGILERTVARMRCPADELMAWLGPAIGPRSFEVGEDVREAFLRSDAGAGEGFVPAGPGKWLADLTLLAKRRLSRAGVGLIYGGAWCTVDEGDLFFSFRRDGVTGRMGSFIWLRPPIEPTPGC